MNITDPLGAMAFETPDKIAILTQNGTLSFGQLIRAVDWAATQFQSKGITAGCYVAVELANPLRHIITAFALAKIGAGQITFRSTDALQIRETVSSELDIAAIVALGSSDSAGSIPVLEPPPPNIAELIELEAASVDAATDENLPYLLIRSSGTTSGIPKFGLLSHRTAGHRVHIPELEPKNQKQRRRLSLLSMQSDAARLNAVRCLMSGGCVAFGPRKARSRDLIRFIKKHQINELSCLPVHAKSFLEHAPSDGILFPDVDVFYVSSTEVPEALRKNIQRYLTPNISVMYAMSEIGMVSIAPQSVVEAHPNAVGRLLTGIDAEVIDANGAVLPSGRVGTFRFRSKGMISSYLGAPNETADAFKQGWFYSSDLGEITDDDVLIHHGRADDIIVFDGLNIHPEEIETVLQRHPAVSEAAAFSAASDARGRLPVAAVVLGSNISMRELASHCRKHLRQRSPIKIFGLPRMPKNAGGKIDRAELEQYYQQKFGTG